MLDTILFFIALACWAFAWCRILPAEGHLLAPVQRNWRQWYRSRYQAELDDAWWWPPLWGCPGCHAGQLAFWSYPIRFHATYDPLVHLCAVGVSILAACYILRTWNQQ